MIREKRKKKKRRKIGLIVFLCILLLLAVGALVVIKVFTVKDVVVEGNELYSDDQVKEWVLNDDYSWNTLYNVLKYKFKKTEEIPFIDTLEISMDNPHVLHVTVYEKGILGYLYIDAIGQNAYFDKDGFVVETSKDVIDGVPKVTGLDCSEVVLYEQLPLENKDILKNLLTLTQVLKKYKVLPNEISYDTSYEPTLNYNGISVIVGDDEELTQKVVRLSYILPQLEGQAGTLHLENWSEQTTDIVFDRAQ
ncbi:MAG: cell division protein FtsQ/DivIB [Roseburia sp.]|uniref:cell division protein FtsQ/DivIB n=1 Tax=Roseburia sp. 831b TaxID=1261635 RepID=UPI0009531C09|nr:cell division protein FtsQ/DivIB [Roseburia sp. 831b]MCI5919681.1 cell division protein FtsQ/DivIB [Roseburia sp.]MDY5883347.1 cell division protein FtsQ/DivIB [Roseburia sp.]WVK71672.1 cell division protein FtsQ/DivIB [Roseburia sp. 831b]